MTEIDTPPRLGDFPEPEPAEGLTVVEVAAGGVHHLDVVKTSGLSGTESSNMNPRPTIHRIGQGVKATACAVSAGVFIAMGSLSTAMNGSQAHASAPTPESAGQITVQSTAPSTLATSIASPTLTAAPFGGEGP
jgi:hypothetical protein